MLVTKTRSLLCAKCNSSPIDVTEAKDPVPCPWFFFPFGLETKTLNPKPQFKNTGKYSRTRGLRR